MDTPYTKPPVEKLTKADRHMRLRDRSLTTLQRLKRVREAFQQTAGDIPIVDTLAEAMDMIEDLRVELKVTR